MEQAIHTNTIAHFLMHHMAHGENNLKHLTTPTQCGYIVTEFRQTLQVQSHLEMPGILVQLGHIQRT